MLSKAIAPELRPYPWQGICTGSSDGAYLNAPGDHADEVQVIVVGAMQFTPFEYAMAVSDHLNSECHVLRVEFMTHVDSKYDRVVRERGFVSIVLKSGQPTD